MPLRAARGTGRRPAGAESPRQRRADDLRHMRRALRAAHGAARRAEVPVGAVVVGAHGAELAEGSNRTLRDCDPTAHAEIVALRAAARRAGNHRLTGSTLYCTLEPCSMCLGAMVQARIGRLVFGADDPKGGALSRGGQSWAGANHRFPIEGGILKPGCAAVLRNFFLERRGFSTSRLTVEATHAQAGRRESNRRRPADFVLTQRPDRRK